MSYKNQGSQRQLLEVQEFVWQRAKNHVLKRRIWQMIYASALAALVTYVLVAVANHYAKNMDVSTIVPCSFLFTAGIAFMLDGLQWPRRNAVCNHMDMLRLAFTPNQRAYSLYELVKELNLGSEIYDKFHADPWHLLIGTNYNE